MDHNTYCKVRNVRPGVIYDFPVPKRAADYDDKLLVSRKGTASLRKAEHSPRRLAFWVVEIWASDTGGLRHYFLPADSEEQVLDLLWDE